MTTDCIEWTGCKDKHGYGKIAYRGSWKLAHRAKWEERNGKIPEGMCILHKCDNPPCINLNHLYMGTPKDNAKDRKQRGRKGDVRGVKNGGVKITEETARKIKAMKGIQSSRVVAASIGISQVQVCNIMRGDSWSHI